MLIDEHFRVMSRNGGFCLFVDLTKVWSKINIEFVRCCVLRSFPRFVLNIIDLASKSRHRRNNIRIVINGEYSSVSGQEL
jgi:hypothetical protein